MSLTSHISPPSITHTNTNIQHHLMTDTPSTPLKCVQLAKHQLDAPTHLPPPNTTLHATFCAHSLSPNTTKRHPQPLVTQYHPTHPPLNSTLHLRIPSSLPVMQTILCSALPTCPISSTPPTPLNLTNTITILSSTPPKTMGLFPPHYQHPVPPSVQLPFCSPPLAPP